MGAISRNTSVGQTSPDIVLSDDSARDKFYQAMNSNLPNSRKNSGESDDGSAPQQNTASASSSPARSDTSATALLKDLAPTDRAIVQEGIANAHGAPDYVANLSALMASKGYQALSPEAKSAVLNYVKNHHGASDVEIAWITLNGSGDARSMTLAQAGDEWRQRKAQEQLISHLSRRNLELIGEIGTQQNCKTAEGFKSWLSENKLDTFYRSVYLPLLDPHSREGISTQVAPMPGDLANAMQNRPVPSGMFPVDKDHPVMTPQEHAIWKRTHPRTQGDLIANNDRLSGLTAPAYIAWMQGAPDETVDALNGLMMAGGAVASANANAPARQPATRPSIVEHPRSAPAPATDPIPRPGAEAPRGPSTIAVAGPPQPPPQAVPAAPPVNKLNGRLEPAPEPRITQPWRMSPARDTKGSDGKSLVNEAGNPGAQGKEQKPTGGSGRALNAGEGQSNTPSRSNGEKTGPVKLAPTDGSREPTAPKPVGSEIDRLQREVDNARREFTDAKKAFSADERGEANKLNNLRTKLNHAEAALDSAGGGSKLPGETKKPEPRTVRVDDDLQNSEFGPGDHPHFDTKPSRQQRVRAAKIDQLQREADSARREYTDAKKAASANERERANKLTDLRTKLNQAEATVEEARKPAPR
jgi:hypothetical protein